VESSLVINYGTVKDKREAPAKLSLSLVINGGGGKNTSHNKKAHKSEREMDHTSLLAFVVVLYFAFGGWF
jgi:hypothetical protein